MRSATAAHAGPLPVLDLATISRLVNEVDALSAARRAFAALADGSVSQPTPIGWDVADGDLHVKGAWLRGSPIFVLKAATGFPHNRERGLPTGSGFMTIFDASTGHPLAILADEGYLTDLRTGAAGALAVALLAPPCVRRIAIIGSGTQARCQLRAISEIATWQEAAAWSPHEDRCDAYCAEMSTRFDKLVQRAPSIEAAVCDADVIVTTTPSRTMLVRDEWVKPGATVVAVGSDSPGKQELDPRLLVNADKVVVDLVRQASALGELQHAMPPQPKATVHAELGVVLTRQQPGRESLDERIVCDLTGTGAQDAAMAEAVWHACQTGGRSRMR